MAKPLGELRQNLYHDGRGQPTTQSVHRRVFASTAIVMGGILASRLLGFFREWTVAHQVGSNAMTDAYYAAFTLPDFLNYLVAGASLSVTFIPVFTKYAAEDREDEAWRVFSTVITFMGLVLIGAGDRRRDLRAAAGSTDRAGIRPAGKAAASFS